MNPYYPSRNDVATLLAEWSSLSPPPWPMMVMPVVSYDSVVVVTGTSSRQQQTVMSGAMMVMQELHLETVFSMFRYADAVGLVMSTSYRPRRRHQQLRLLTSPPS
jgi:hypothetical protein